MYVTPAQVRGVSVPDGGDTPSGTDKATPASFTDDQLTPAIVQAQAIVDAYLARVVSVPYADGSVPTLVQTLTAFEAAYFAELTLRKTKDLEKDDPFRLRHDWVMTTLDKISKGDIVIPSPDVDETVTATAYDQYEGRLWLAQDFDMREVTRPNPYV